MTAADAARATARLQAVAEVLADTRTRKAAPPRPLGILANPASGKDIRRVAARASVFGSQEKRIIVERFLIGATRTAPCPILYFDDTHGIARSAVVSAGITATPLPVTCTGNAADTTHAATAMRAAGCGVAIVFGGDGTSRAFAKGWPDAPLLAIATGTNNAFPEWVEATVAGIAAALTASGTASLAAVARPAKAIHVEADGMSELALIDAATTTHRFAGARALNDAHHLSSALLTRASPATVGLGGVGGLLCAVTDAEDFGLAIRFAAPGHPARWRLRAVTAPGKLEDVDVASVRRVRLGERVTAAGPGALALDGERERPLAANARVTMTVRRDGPHVIDVGRALATLNAPSEALEVADAV